MAHRAVLIGGPYDGDRGLLPEPVPAVWVWECSTPRIFCPCDGIHWEADPEDIPGGGGAPRYDLDEDSRATELLAYRYEGLARPEDALREWAAADLVSA